MFEGSLMHQKTLQGTDDRTGLKLCYLDFDGVVHPESVFQCPSRGIYIGTPGHTLFEWQLILEGLLAPYHDVKIVLSTSWVRARSYEFARSQLTPALQAKVIGATFHNRHIRKDEFDMMSRGVQVESDVMRRQPMAWFAIDDDGEGWPVACQQRLVLTDGNLGLSDTAVQAKIRAVLKAL
jgi:hypothetical protein